MRLNLQSDYALRVLIYAAMRPESLCTVSSVASFYDISRNHLVKVVHTLAVAGIVASVRGRGGGFRLARPATEIRLGDVVRATENDFQLVECFGTESECAIERGCRLKKVLASARDAFLAVLDEATLADLTLRNAPLRKLLPLAS